MGTMMMVFKGQVDESGAVREMISDHLDAMTRKPAQMKSKTTYISKDEHLYEGFKKTDKGWEPSLRALRREMLMSSETRRPGPLEKTTSRTWFSSLALGRISTVETSLLSGSTMPRPYWPR